MTLAQILQRRVKATKAESDEGSSVTANAVGEQGDIDSDEDDSMIEEHGENDENTPQDDEEALEEDADYSEVRPSLPNYYITLSLILRPSPPPRHLQRNNPSQISPSAPSLPPRPPLGLNESDPSHQTVLASGVPHLRFSKHRSESLERKITASTRARRSTPPQNFHRRRLSLASALSWLLLRSPTATRALKLSLGPLIQPS